MNDDEECNDGDHEHDHHEATASDGQNSTVINGHIYGPRH